MIACIKSALSFSFVHEYIEDPDLPGVEGVALFLRCHAGKMHFNQPGQASLIFQVTKQSNTVSHGASLIF